ncbi:MAG: DUF5717 family protein [Lachnospiraceae bacterium]|nr:DUF5717 family protein [Lachnospiraceae bacterium]MCM1240060.1 DUF5717 family protein [Lachnospiraceae bacterium]
MGEYEMQKMIDQILEGNFDYENGSLDFSCLKIDISLHRGEDYEGSFRVYAPAGKFTAGSVTTSDLRMECLTGEFVGTDEEIAYRFHGEHMEEGEVVKGNFYIVSNQGEYYLPFVVSVEHTMLESSVGPVRNLFHFANLAKSSWEEALKLFYSSDFIRVFTGSDAQYADVYRGLSAYPGQEQNMDEFLIRINKKQSIEYLVEEKQLVLESALGENAYSVTESGLSIVRNGWGYTRLHVECSGDFLFTEKEVLTDNDFLGNRCRLPVFIDGKSCRRGKNFGQIFLYDSHVSLTIPVTVTSGDRQPDLSVRLTRKQSTVQIMELYQSFRLKKIGTSAWLKETGKLVERQVFQNENDIATRLFQAQLLITEEKYNEAGWILDHVAELLEEQPREETCLAYYLYLTTLIHREEKYINRVASDVEQIYKQDTSNWRVAWLLLYLSGEYNRSASAKWAFLEKQYDHGSRSPVIYIEALILLNNNPALLRKLDGFERQLLNYGMKREFLNSEVVEQLLYLIGRVREFSPVMFRILQRLYRKKQDHRILQEICTLLIKGGKTGRKYFRWYQDGVEAQLRITNLYEHYMMSLDMNASCKLPKQVLMYFSYQNSMNYEQAAYLYDYILKNRDKLGDLYLTYQPRMEWFILDQIRKEHINRHLANLYDKLLRPDMIDEQTAKPLSKLLFAHQIRVEDDRIRKVYVYQPYNLRPAEYVLNGGCTWVALYGNEYTIVLEDMWRNRFIHSVEYTMEKLMLPGKYLRMVSPFVDDCTGLDLYLSENERESMPDSEESVNRALRVLRSPEVDVPVKRELYLKVLQYYYEKDNMEALDAYLKRIPGDELTMEERGTVMKYMVYRGDIDLAGQWLEKYGPYFMDVKILVRLLGPLMERRSMVDDPVLTAAACSVFQRGKYDSTVLEYLTRYYEGMTKNMRDIWKAAKSFDVDCYKLSERMLVQMLYSGAFVGEKMEIFRYYVSQGAKQEVEEAFLAQCAYEYFVHDRVTEGYVYQEIGNMSRRSEPVQKICKLAFLKYYAENKSERQREQMELAESFLRELMAEGIHLKFFREYVEYPDLQQELTDKTIIEYRATSGGRACIHYVMLYENGESDEYKAEYMRDVYGGVCFREFVLFFGENLQYYITEEVNGEEQLTESGTIQNSDAGTGAENGRYQLLNDIVLSRAMEDYDTMDDLLEEYYRKEFLNGQLFVLR